MTSSSQEHINIYIYIHTDDRRCKTDLEQKGETKKVKREILLPIIIIIRSRDLPSVKRLPANLLPYQDTLP